VVREIESAGTEIVGICVAASFQLTFAFQIADRLRASGYDGHIVLGGNTVSRLLSELSAHWVFDLVDALIPFQGEAPLLDLCAALEKQNSLELVPGIVWRDPKRRVVRNSPARNLSPDSHAIPDYTDLPLNAYWGVNYLCVVAARGCYYGKCSFCAIPYGWGNGGFGGTRSADRTFADMLVLHERHGTTRFKFVDEALSPHFMRELAALVANSRAPFEWEGYTRLERSWTDEAFVRDVAYGGFKKGYFGLELLPSEGRSLLNKRDQADPTHLLEMCNAHGIRTHLFCMFGYPGTGEHDAARTTDFLLRNQSLIDTADIFPWSYAKHTTVENVRPLIKPGEDLTLEFEHRSIGPPVLSAQEVTELASKYEELLWAEVPRLLHPTYRLVSPWGTCSVESEGWDLRAQALVQA
jgi:radical SAM superfamily enzyme YgiQ (UPF0313 family)